MRKLLLSVCFICTFIPLVHGQTKPRIAVLDFDYATVRTTSQALFGTEVDIGKGITDMLVDKLVNGSTFSVIERKALDSIMREQNISNSDRFDSSSAALIGRLLGVDAIVVGSITQFGNDDSSRGGAGAVAAGVLGGFGIKRSTGKAVVGITTRIVNVDTGEILSSVTGTGESKRTSTSLAGLFANSGGAAAGAVDMSSSNFRETIIGEAVSNAVDSVASLLHENSGRITARVIKIEGRVLDVDGYELTMDAGSNAGVKVGDIFTVGRVTREIRDPDTNVVVRRVEEKIGDVEITEVGAQYSVGNFRGSAPAQAGDRIRN
jgi:curli biogenesis system outer membrane secretion channel CsgG